MIMRNSVFAWIAVTTALLLLVPLAIQLTVGSGVDGVGFNWTPLDFVVMGALIFVQAIKRMLMIVWAAGRPT